MAAGKKAVLFTLVFVFACNNYIWADEMSLEDTVRQLQERIKVLEKKVSEQDKYIASQKARVLIQQQEINEHESKISKFEDKLHYKEDLPVRFMDGVEVGAGATLVIQGTDNVNGGDNTINDSRTDSSYSVDITIEKKIKEVGARAFLHLEAGTGSGIEDDLTLFNNVNRDTDNDNTVRVTELWYEQSLFKDNASLTFGKLDASVYFDNNEVANDETTQFLGRIFRNNPAIELPDNTAGIRISYTPLEWIELGCGIFDGNNDWEKITDNLFNIGQVTFKTNFFDLPGNYRFLGWKNNIHHTKWLDDTQRKETAYGFGLSFDQEITDIVALFTRYGWQDPKTYNPEITATGALNYSLEHSWSAGFQVEGKPWGREKDVFAFAVGQAIPSNDYKKATGRLARSEGHLETYYRIFVNDHLYISPDFQYIWNPFGKDVSGDANNIFVGGIRTQLDF